MPVINRIAEFSDEMAGWRQHIHAHPETAFEEHKPPRLLLKTSKLWNKCSYWTSSDWRRWNSGRAPW